MGVETIYTELKVWIEKEYRVIRNETIALYKMAMKDYNKLVKLFEETKFAELAAYFQKKYNQLLMKLLVVKEKVEELKEKVKAVLVKYELKMKEMYKKYETEVKQYYKVVSGKIIKVYNECRLFVEKEGKLLIRDVTDIYHKLKAMVEAEYNIVKEIMKKLYKKVETEITTKYKELLDKWNKSTLRKELIALQKMTIAETIEAIKKWKTALNSVFSRIDRLVIEELADVKKIVIEVIEEAEKVSKQLSEKLTVEITNLLKKYNPVMTKIKAALKWLEHEARETAVFVYKYYNLQHKYDQIKDFIMKKAAEISKEVKVTVEKVKQIVLKVPQILKKFMDKYGEELMKLVKKIQIKVNELVAKKKKKKKKRGEKKKKKKKKKKK